MLSQLNQIQCTTDSTKYKYGSTVITNTVWYMQ